MATIAEQLTSLANTKTAIKEAIINKGVQVADTDPFSAYPAKISQIQAGGGAPATKFGVSVDNLIGNVDENGVYNKPKEPIVLDLTGVKELPNNAFIYKFIFADDVTIIAPDLTTIGSSAFEQACFATNKITARFDSLEEIVNYGNVFDGAFAGGVYTHPVYDVVFGKLKKITGSSAFADCFDRGTVDLDYTFPALEEIQANLCFRSLATGTYRLSKVKKIIGPSARTSATIYPSFLGTLDFYLPSATELGGYVTYARSNYKCNLHFAAANQAAIEACSGYEYKFGATEIYFDL